MHTGSPACIPVPLPRPEGLRGRPSLQSQRANHLPDPAPVMGTSNHRPAGPAARFQEAEHPELRQSSRRVQLRQSAGA